MPLEQISGLFSDLHGDDFRTVLGAEVYARLQAIIATCGKQGRNIFATLRDIFSCQPVSLMAT